MGQLKNEMVDAEQALYDIEPETITTQNRDLFYEEVMMRLDKAKHPQTHNIAMGWAVDKYLRDEGIFSGLL
tara:strand:- start:1164 stop:1376 length:213 start_codon:yes stop_codon:yes gene_type:complete